MTHALPSWLPLLGALPLLVVALYLLAGTLIEPDGGESVPYDLSDDWDAQAERGGW